MIIICLVLYSIWIFFFWFFWHMIITIVYHFIKVSKDTIDHSYIAYDQYTRDYHRYWPAAGVVVAANVKRAFFCVLV